MKLNAPPKHPNSVQDYVDEINKQKEKPIKEQLEDLKVAGAKLLVALDKIISEL